MTTVNHNKTQPPTQQATLIIVTITGMKTRHLSSGLTITKLQQQPLPSSSYAAQLSLEKKSSHTEHWRRRCSFIFKNQSDRQTGMKWQGDNVMVWRGDL